MRLGTVREWHDEAGWGVIESPATPRGCFAHRSSLRVSGHRTLAIGTEVFFECEPARQEGYDFVATAVWPEGTDPLPVRVFRASELIPADPTPGMDRRLAFELPMLWSGQVVTAPGTTSGWHHHDTNDSSLYVVSGILRFEFEGRAEPLDAVAGDFVHVPPHTVHRESNPTDEPSLAVIARVGGGIPTVNVDRAPPPHR